MPHLDTFQNQVEPGRVDLETRPDHPDLPVAFRCDIIDEETVKVGVGQQLDEVALGGDEGSHIRSTW